MGVARSLRRAITSAGVSLGATAGIVGAQSGGAPAIIGVVKTAEAGLPLPYSVIAIPSLGREQFTNDRGGFSLRELPVGPLKLRIRHIGFTPRDTTVTLRMGDTLRIEIALARLAIRLDAMRVSAACQASGDAAGSAALLDLFEQVRQNALQLALLVRSHPFTRRMTRSEVVRMIDGTFAVGSPEAFQMRGTADVGYKPGKVFRNAGGGVVSVALPVLQDFADSVFIAKHCFSYGGDTTIDTARFVRVMFSPVSELKDPDIEGTVTLRADSYGLVAVEMRTTAVPKSLAKSISSIRAVTEFQDVLPGIALISRVESFLAPGPDRMKSEPKVASRGEIQMLIGINWQKGPP